MELLRTYLSKALRAASDTGTQDKIAYSVQQVLHQYKRFHGATLPAQAAEAGVSHSTASLAQAIEARNRAPAAADAEEPAIAGSDGADIQGTHISYTADGAVDRGVVPREFEGVLRTDLGAIDRGRDKSGTVPAVVIDDDAGASESDSVRLLMEVLAPYWASALRLSKVLAPAGRADGPYVPIYQCELESASASAAPITISSAAGRTRGTVDLFDSWMTKWCRHLVDQLCVASPTRRDLWEACRTIVMTDVSTALFLLPYLVRDALMHGGDRVAGEVVAEVRAILTQSADDSRVEAVRVARGGLMDEELASQSSGFRHRAKQTCFALLDTIRRWHSGAAFPTPQSSGKPFPTSCRGDASVSRLLSSVAYEDLATAAVQVRAHTRALMHLETHLRERNDDAYCSARFLEASGDTGGCALELNDQFSFRYDTLHSRHRLAGAPLVGGVISGAIPYSREELGFLQVLYSNIDDPDSMSGVTTFRARLLFGESSMPSTDSAAAIERMRSLREHIRDLEHEGRWEDALLCYEQAIQTVEDAAGGLLSASAGESAAVVRDGGEGASMEDGGDANVAADVVGIAAVAAESDASIRQLHSGLLRCLCNVGHLETARELRRESTRTFKS